MVPGACAGRRVRSHKHTNGQETQAWVPAVTGRPCGQRLPFRPRVHERAPLRSRSTPTWSRAASTPPRCPTTSTSACAWSTPRWSTPGRQGRGADRRVERLEPRPHRSRPHSRRSAPRSSSKLKALAERPLPRQGLSRTPDPRVLQEPGWIHRTTGGWDATTTRLRARRARALHLRRAQLRRPDLRGAPRHPRASRRNRDPKRIFEIGSSSGNFTLQIQKGSPTPRSSSCDISLRMLEQGQRIGNENGCSWGAAPAAGEDTGFESGSFDLVTSFIVIHEVSAAITVRHIQEAFRLLVPGRRTAAQRRPALRRARQGRRAAGPTTSASTAANRSGATLRCSTSAPPRAPLASSTCARRAEGRGRLSLVRLGRSRPRAAWNSRST